MLTTELAKAYNGLCHHISIVEMVRKHIWIIAFGARTKKRHFRAADPTGTGQAGLGKFLKCMI